MRIIILLLSAALFFSCSSVDTNPADNLITEIPVIKAFIKQEHLNILHENRHGKPEVPITFSYKNKIYKGRVEPQGAGSRYWPKWSYEIILTGGQTLEGFTNFNLSAQVADETMMRTDIGIYFYEAMEFPLFKSTQVFLIINDDNKGLYALTERIEVPFFQRRGMPLWELIKSGFSSSFTFAEPNDLALSFQKEYPDDNNLNSMAELIYAIDTTKPEDLLHQSFLNIFNVDRYLKYHVVTTVTAGADAFSNNMYFYKPMPGSPFQVIPWDFDRIFDFKYQRIFVGNNEIIQKLFQNDDIFNIYKQYFRAYIDNIYTVEKIEELVAINSARLRNAYRFDPYLGGAGYDFDDEVNKLLTFMLDRRKLYFDNWDKFHNPYK